MTSLARGLAVIRGFAGDDRTLSIAQLSERTGLSRAAVRRCLYTLAKLGYVSVAGRHDYALQPKLLGLGQAYLASTPLVVTAQPHLDEVSETVGESCSLAILDGDDILYLARSVSSRIISVTLNVGSRLPAYCTSIGHVLLAALPQEALSSYLSHVTLHSYTPQTIHSANALRKVLEDVRRNGYGIADQQMESGVRSIAVPVRDSRGQVVAGINVIVQTGRRTLREMKSACLPALERASLAIGAQLVN